jgi:hypothetical protein
MPNAEIAQIVKEDVVYGLQGVFGRRVEFDEEPVIVNPALDDGDAEQPIQSLTAVPWIYRCLHDGDFQGLFRTGKELEIHGVTFVDGRGGSQMLHRYVDWMGVVNQLGLDVSWRVPVDEDQYRRVRDQLNAEREEREESDES